MTGKILIPLLNNREEEESFLEKAIDEANFSPGFSKKAVEDSKEIVLVAVIDTGAMVGKFGFAASQMSQCNSTTEKCKELLEKKGVKVEDILEWGDTLSKISSTARLKKAKKIVMKKQDNHYFETLVKNLKKEGFELTLIEIPKPNPSG